MSPRAVPAAPPRRRPPGRWRGAFLAVALALAGSGAGCRAAPARAPEGDGGLPVYPAARRVAAQPTPAGDARVERWRVPVRGGDDPARVAAGRDEVLAWYREAMADAGYAARTDPAAPLVVFANAAGCTAYVSVYVDPADARAVLVDVGRSDDAEACATPTPPRR